MKNTTPRNIMYQLCEYIVALMFVLNCRSIWTALTNTENFTRLVRYLLIAALLGCILLNSELKRNKLNQGIMVAALLMIYWIVYSLLSSYARSEVLQFTIVVCTLLVFHYTCDSPESVPEVLIKYEQIMLWIAGISLFFWIFGSQLRWIAPNMSAYTTWTDTGDPKLIKGYWGIIFEIQKAYITIPFDVKIIRNSAIFTEAPMASLQFSVALMIEMLLKKTPNRKKCALLVAAIISTVSYWGYIVCIILFIWKFTFTKRKGRFLNAVKVMIIPVIAVVGGIIIYSLINARADSGSGVIRIDDFSVGLRAWIAQPFLGGGLNNLKYVQSFMEGWRSYNTGFSNSILMLLACGGIYFIFPILICWGICIKNIIASSNIEVKLFIALILASYMLIFITYQYLFFFLFICCMNADRWELKDADKPKMRKVKLIW